MRIRPARRIRGRLTLPGDKSISHRAAIMAALARGRSRIDNYSTSEDCARTLQCLSRLGVTTEREGSRVQVTGAGGIHRKLVAPDAAAALDCGNSGTTMRLLAGVLAGQDFASTLTGDDSLCSRPMRRVIEPLELMGARISSSQGRAPLRIEGRRPLAAINYLMPFPSAQVKSCILLAGLSAEGRTQVIEKRGRTRDHTERLLGSFGVPVETRQEGQGDALSLTIAVEGPASFSARDVMIPGDISSAVFFIAAAALLPGSELAIEAVGLNPTRTQILQTLLELQADLKVIDDEHNRGHEPSGTIRVRGREEGLLAPLAGTGTNILEGSLIPQLIDELPMLAVVGTQVEGGIKIRDAAELRVKESDRIAAVVKNLRAMGAEVEEYEDGLSVHGPTRLRGTRLDAFKDHRIAMAFAVAALIAEGESEIEGAKECVGVSFPKFFEILESVIER